MNIKKNCYLNEMNNDIYTNNLKLPKGINLNNNFKNTIKTNNEIASKKIKCVVIALPGRSFSNKFIKAWTNTIVILFQKYKVIVVSEYSSFVPFSRMNTLGLDVGRGPNQKPFNGELDYDVWLTIDSDIVFTPEQIIELIENTNTYPVVSGLYKMENMQQYACVKTWDEEFFIKNKTFEFMTPKDVEEYKKNTGKKFMDVAYNGLGFFACRRGVIESIRYPYFHRELQEIRDEKGNTIMIDMCSEDVAFCKNLIDAGYCIKVNCDLIVGHEKSLVI